MKNSNPYRFLFIAPFLMFNYFITNAQSESTIKACYQAMTTVDLSGGMWIWGNRTSLDDTVSAKLEGVINNYDVPWCASFGCCDSLSFNGMSISLHTIKADSSYRIFITGGLKGGAYFTDGFVEIPSGWGIDSIINMSNNPGTGAYDTVINNTINFHSGTTYGGCVCSDCGRAKISYYLSRREILPTAITGNESDILMAYPNPAKDHITIKMDYYTKMTDYSLKIFNILGEVVYETKVSRSVYEINTSNWKGRGTYLISLTDTNNMIRATKKIVVK